MRTCAYIECGVEFENSTFNQKYHSNECCRRATNARLMEQYYERQARIKGRIRVCAGEQCDTKLSRYNTGKICQKCEAEITKAGRQKLLEYLKGENGE